MANAQVEAFRPTGLLQIEDSDIGLPLSNSFVSNGLLGDPSSERPASSGQDTLPHCTSVAPTSPLRPNGLLDTTGVELPSSAPITLPRPSLRSSTFDGKTIFLKRRTRTTGTLKGHSTAQKPIGSLLNVPIHRLIDELSATTAQGLMQQPDAEETLWVDRYRPKRFTDLLGDERVHREVLSWVKQWDFYGERFASSEDELDRPQEKILLLSGPPGLGKTTLAHVVAKQADTIDARSGQVVDERIRPALESGYAVGSSKPVLVVIDEIDGATGDNSHGFINKLVQLTYEKTNKSRGKKKGDKSNQVLRRPIICICNDLYVSSLTKLRSLARVIRFTRPADIHVVKRLQDICDTEGLRADSRALSTLVGISLGDLRGCLNTLQFIKGRSQGVTEQLVRSATVGMKEADANYLSVLTDLFCPMSKKRVKDRGMGEADESKYVERLSCAVEATGALDRVALGCFEHYANLHRHDATFARYKKANEWLVAYDILSGSMRAEREYGVLQYLSYNLVPFFPLFQERGGPRVERPKADWEWHVKTRTNEEIYKSLARAARTGNARLAGHFCDLVSEPVLSLEFAPLLNRIISPPIRPVNSQVIRPEEKAVLSRLVNIMVSLELRFVQERAEDGQLVYKLDPPVDVFVTYDGKRAADIAPPRYAVRHLVSTEINAQLAVRHVEAIERMKATKPSIGAREANDIENNSSQDMGEGMFVASTAADEPPRKRAKTTTADVDAMEKPAVDFFGRPIMTPIANNKPVSSRQQATPVYRVSFKFKEGNSAAVRKPVKMASFL
ncbi:P-loop containing nucleoside triphosphate hydrolase protein [Multifurca ochricompacta]|uniref:P-loop containing nucleoside triphosphate hydrolase protein n=1 Tax=Multifurca ochricompacta TaxID=376703 RepID=A0AAD4MC10_9AGAM|nr:P-loop containing nucleoside triphosphate hydrolase protein [Multifurca ochricompacta]